MRMKILELACVVIVVTYVVLRARRDRSALSRLALLAIAGWIGEDTVIRAYGFYSYSAEWSLFLDRTPLLIVAIWPVVIDSASMLARRLLGDAHRGIPLVAALVVLADASLIEPIAVRAGLWSWTEPGLFAVPPIGILGWAFFAAAAVAWLERVPRARAGVVIAAPVFAHVLLVATWWIALRWVNESIASWAAAWASWLVLLPIAVASWRAALRSRVPTFDMLLRAPGALFFFVLLAMHGRDSLPLVVYALAFAPPYLALVRFGEWAPRSRADGLSRDEAALRTR